MQWTLCCNSPASEKSTLECSSYISWLDANALRNCQRNCFKFCKITCCGGKYEILHLSSFGPLLLGEGRPCRISSWLATLGKHRQGSDRTRGGESNPSLIRKENEPQIWHTLMTYLFCSAVTFSGGGLFLQILLKEQSWSSVPVTWRVWLHVLLLPIVSQWSLDSPHHYDGWAYLFPTNCPPTY